jgi:hypothetical protein
MLKNIYGGGAAVYGKMWKKYIYSVEPERLLISIQ